MTDIVVKVSPDSGTLFPLSRDQLSSEISDSLIGELPLGDVMGDLQDPVSLPVRSLSEEMLSETFTRLPPLAIRTVS